MAALAVQTMTTAGLSVSYVAADSTGDSFVNNGKTFIHVKNGGGSSIDVTVNSVTPCDQGFDHNAIVAVPASGEKMIGPFLQTRFNSCDGKTSVTYSAVTSVTVAAVSL